MQSHQQHKERDGIHGPETHTEKQTEDEMPLSETAYSADEEETYAEGNTLPADSDNQPLQRDVAQDQLEQDKAFIGICIPSHRNKKYGSTGHYLPNV